MRKSSPKPEPVDNPGGLNKENTESEPIETIESGESLDNSPVNGGFSPEEGIIPDPPPEEDGISNNDYPLNGISGKTEPPDETSEVNSDIEYVYFPDRSYFFVFGPASAGKTVLMWSIYDYISMIRGDRYRDKLINLNRRDVLYENEGNVLIKQFDECSEGGYKTFPPGTPPIRAQKGQVPKHLNFEFRPFDESKENFPFCFMDMAGEDLENIDFNSNKPLPPSIRTYIEDVDKKNLCFIYVIDPIEGRKSYAQQTTLFNAFINLLDHNNHDNTPCLILVSKWDAVEGYDDVKSYLKEKHLKVWNAINSRGYNYAEFSIGKVDGEKIVKYDYSYAERVFNWMYKMQIGYGLGEGENRKPERKNKIIKFLKKYI